MKIKKSISILLLLATSILLFGCECKSQCPVKSLLSSNSHQTSHAANNHSKK